MFSNNIKDTYATDIIKKVPPRYSPLLNSKYTSFKRVILAILASSKIYDNSV